MYKFIRIGNIYYAAKVEEFSNGIDILLQNGQGISQGFIARKNDGSGEFVTPSGQVIHAHC